MLKFYFVFFLSFFSPVVFADNQFVVEVDRKSIALDESLNLVFSIQVSGTSDFEGIQFTAPQFEVVNEMNSTFIESFYENGRFGMRNNRKITKVLRPLNEGVHTIGNISAKIDGKKLTASPIIIRVIKAGTGAQPSMPSNAGVSLSSPGSIVGKGSKNEPYFLKADVSKNKAFLGEQIVVSYYLYFRVRASSPQIDKFPELNGFLREDLELPVIGGQLPQDQVTIGNTLYQRALLAKYAVYPLKVGKLKIDPMGIKLIYYVSPDVNSMNDPVAQFFGQAMSEAKTGVTRSEVVEIDVLDLPAEGKTSQFQGAIGNFEGSVGFENNKTQAQVKINEALSVFLSIRGKGSLTSIDPPKIKLPDGIELYESKAKNSINSEGNGEKKFEYVVIPRQGGQFEIPPIEFSFFNPESKDYRSITTSPLTLIVEGTSEVTQKQNKLEGEIVGTSAIQNKPIGYLDLILDYPTQNSKQGNVFSLTPVKWGAVVLLIILLTLMLFFILDIYVLNQKLKQKVIKWRASKKLKVKSEMFFDKENFLKLIHQLNFELKAVDSFSALLSRSQKVNNILNELILFLVLRSSKNTNNAMDLTALSALAGDAILKQIEETASIEQGGYIREICIKLLELKENINNVLYAMQYSSQSSTDKGALDAQAVDLKKHSFNLIEFVEKNSGI